MDRLWKILAANTWILSVGTKHFGVQDFASFEINSFQNFHVSAFAETWHAQFLAPPWYWELSSHVVVLLLACTARIRVRGALCEDAEQPPALWRPDIAFKVMRRSAASAGFKS